MKDIINIHEGLRPTTNCHAQSPIPRQHPTPAMKAAARAPLDNPCSPDRPAPQARQPRRRAPPQSAPPSLPSTSRAHPTSQAAPSIPPLALLDAAFRAYTERCAAELAHLRTTCARAVLKERQDREKWRAHCAAFKRERDVARERVRVLIGEREAHLVRPARAGADEIGPEDGDGEAFSEDSRSAPSRETTPSSTAVISDPEDDWSAYLLPYPTPAGLVYPSLPSPSSSSSSSHKRSRSADAVPSSSSAKRDSTAFDLTVTENPHGDRLIPTERAMKRRRSEDPPPTPRRPAAAGKDLRPTIELSHVDLMYVPQNGTLVCRVCTLASSKLPTSPGAPPPRVASFPTDAAWDTLRDHCAKEHPDECADVARLHPAEVYELRRRLAVR